MGILLIYKIICQKHAILGLAAAADIVNLLFKRRGS